MKQRVISAIIASILIIPIVLIGGNLYKAGVIALGLIGLYELLKAYENNKKIPLFMKFISIYSFIFALLENFNNNSFSITLSLKYIILYTI